MLFAQYLRDDLKIATLLTPYDGDNTFPADSIVSYWLLNCHPKTLKKSLRPLLKKEHEKFNPNVLGKHSGSVLFNIYTAYLFNRFKTLKLS